MKRYDLLLFRMGLSICAASVTTPGLAATVCAPMGAATGLDVSGYQPKTNWNTVKTAGRSFAFVKATQGVGIINSDFAIYWKTLASLSMIRGAYHYFVNSDDPTEQATRFLSEVGKEETGELPAMLDLEEVDETPHSTVLARALQWLERVEAATGKTPIIYTSPGYWQGLGNAQAVAAFAKYPLFVSDYGVRCPSVPAPWKTWAFWQTSGTGTIPGVPEKVDTDEFNGNALQLAGYALE